jgi:hypothetical protein
LFVGKVLLEAVLQVEADPKKKLRSTQYLGYGGHRRVTPFDQVW